MTTASATGLRVELSAEEMRVAASTGVERRLRAIARNRQHRYAWSGDGVWAIDIQAAGAELAVAKVLGRYWADTAAPDTDGDVGTGVQVRWTRLANGSLLLHPSDPDDHAYVLVTGEMPSFEIPGWCWGRDGKDERFWREHTGRPAFFVPQDALRPLPDRT